MRLLAATALALTAAAAAALRPGPSLRRPAHLVVRHLNRLLLEQAEAVRGDDGLTARLRADDPRSVHIREILKLKDGDILRCGETVIDLGPERDVVYVPRPSTVLILGLPRPPRLERIIPIATSLGVEKIVLVSARKVEKAYFGSHLLRDPKALRQLLLEGLAQAANDCHCPEVVVQRSFRSLVENDLDALAGEDDCLKIVGHPPMPSDGEAVTVSLRGFDLFLPGTRPAVSARPRAVVAIGPEGGWTTGEVQAFAARGFRTLSLGERILRTDVAVTVALGLVGQWQDLQHALGDSGGGRGA